MKIKKKHVLVISAVISLLVLTSPWLLTMSLISKVYFPTTVYEVIDDIRFAYYLPASKQVYLCANMRPYNDKKSIQNGILVDVGHFLDQLNYENSVVPDEQYRNIGVYRVLLPESVLSKTCKSGVETANVRRLELGLKKFQFEPYQRDRLTKLRTNSEAGEIYLVSNFRGFIFVTPKPLRDSSFYIGSKVESSGHETESYVLFEILFDKEDSGNKLWLLLTPIYVVGDILSGPIQHFLMYKSLN